MDDGRTLRELLEAHDVEVKQEMADLEANIDEEVEKMRAEYNDNRIGPGVTKCFRLMEIQFRALRVDLRMVHEYKKKERARQAAQEKDGKADRTG